MKRCVSVVRKVLLINHGVHEQDVLFCLQACNVHQIDYASRSRSSDVRAG